MGMVIVSIWGNWAEVNADGFEVGKDGLIPDPLKPYPKSPPPHAAPLAHGNGIRFTFPAGTLDSDAIYAWRVRANYGPRQKRLYDVQVTESKNNAWGIGTANAFAVAARALMEGGAKSKYGVSSPFVFATWSAKDLATYCSKIMHAAHNGADDIGWVEL